MRGVILYSARTVKAGDAMQSFIRSALVAASFACVGVSTTTLAAAPPEAVTRAVADTARPEADRVRDADRKPAELIALIGLKPGSSIADMLPGGGYFTRIFSKVVGPTGLVYAWGGGAAITTMAADANYPNIKVAARDTALPEKVDFVWTSLNYHDMRNRSADLTPQNKMVWDSLKPGGFYIVIDHAAETGSGARDIQAMHRIDPELVKKEVTSVGFKLATESALLKHAADDHKKPSSQVDRGKTDQFVLIFQKPAA
jgi:predicted methyltransferase